MKTLLGGLFIAARILIMTTSGLCSLVVIIFGFGAAFRNPSIVLMPLIIGGIPFAVGFSALRLGQALLPEADAERE